MNSVFDARRVCAAWIVPLHLLTSAAAAPELSGSAAQADVIAHQITLADMLSAVLAKNPDIQLVERQQEIERAGLLAAGAPFDPLMATSGTSAREGTRDPQTGIDTLARQLAYRFTFQQQLRQGTVLTSEIGATQASLASRSNAASNHVSVKLNVLVPLLKDRGGIVTSAPERVSRTRVEAGVLTLRHTTSETVYAASVAYWDYVAAQKRLAVQQSAEARAQQLVDDTRTLVSADERAAADLTQMLGNLAAKRVVRIGAEQTVLEARQQLGLVMGLPPEQTTNLPEASTEFPGVGPDWAPSPLPQRLVDLALSRRADLRAAELGLRSAQTLRSAAENDIKPRFDLLTGVGFTGLDPGSGLSRFLSALYRSVPGVDTSLQVRYQFFTGNVEARGRLLQSIATQEQQRIAYDDLKRRISTGVQVAHQALNRGGLEMRESETAVRLFESVVQSEQRKFQLGVSTLFDVIQAQDGLTNAMLGEIASRGSYAVAIAMLRFQTGLLLNAGSGPSAVEPGNLLTPP